MSSGKGRGKASSSTAAASSPPTSAKDDVGSPQSGRKGLTSSSKPATTEDRGVDHAAEDSDGGDRGYGYEHTDDEGEEDSSRAAEARDARYPLMTESEAMDALARQKRLEAQLQATMAQMAALERLAMQAGRADLLKAPGLRHRHRGGAAAAAAEDEDEDDGADEDRDEDEDEDDGDEGADDDAEDDGDVGEGTKPAAGTLAATAGARASRAAQDAQTGAGSVRRSDKFIVNPSDTYLPPHVAARGVQPPADDCAILCAGLFGFILLFAFGAIMVSYERLLYTQPMACIGAGWAQSAVLMFCLRDASLAPAINALAEAAFRVAAFLLSPSAQPPFSVSPPLSASLSLLPLGPSLCLSLCSPSSACPTTCSWRAPWPP